MDGFIFNSRTTQGVVSGLVGTGRLGVVAHPGHDHRPATATPAQIAARAAEPGPLRVLFIGNLIPRKGLHTVLDALAQAPDAARLTVAGNAGSDPAYAAAIRGQINRLGLTDRVALLGAASDEALGRLLAGSHILAVPSSYEGYGIVYADIPVRAGSNCGCSAPRSARRACVRDTRRNRAFSSVRTPDDQPARSPLGRRCRRRSGCRRR